MHEGHRSRLKNRFLKDGLDGFELHNVVELLLFFGIPYKDTNEIAHRLCDRFGTLSNIIDAPFEQLCEISGVGENAATLIKLIAPLSRLYLEDKYSDSEPLDCVDRIGEYILAKYRFYDYEFFSMLSMDSSLNVISFDIVNKGVVNATEVSVRNAVTTALRTGAVNVAIAHNHPGGSALPSTEDIITTKKLIESLKLVGVTVVDHIIVADNDFVSLRSSMQYEKLFKR
ncbi:MAG: JAB domain-containing protein [Firmicutes bacterium]|nr:JAB domain-containing protein [Bacillota bacterium]